MWWRKRSAQKCHWILSRGSSQKKWQFKIGLQKNKRQDAWSNWNDERMYYTRLRFRKYKGRICWWSWTKSEIPKYLCKCWRGREIRILHRWRGLPTERLRENFPTWFRNDVRWQSNLGTNGTSLQICWTFAISESRSMLGFGYYRTADR